MHNHKRQSGILLNPTSFPGKFSRGDLGVEAFTFIDILSKMNQSLWQVLPLGPVDSTLSPYSTSSAFAGDPNLISIDFLIKKRILKKSDFDKIKKNKYSKIDLLFLASKNILKNRNSKHFEDFKNFCLKNKYWLNDFSKYAALKNENQNNSWNLWDYDKPINDDLVNSYKVIQYFFDLNWKSIKKYANKKSIEIIGDLPIYVDYDSADVWSQKKLFQLDDDVSMLYEAGCPPCEFNIDGQHWGMPVYNWSEHINSDFDWWKNRFIRMFDLFDCIRIDHFIGFERYFSIPIGKKTKKGFWSQSPGEKLFSSIDFKKNNYNIFVEDLGDVTKEVIDLRNKFNLPGMRILLFDITKNTKNINYSRQSVLYTGTHDNDTLVGWINSHDEKNSDLPFLKKFNKKKLSWELIEFVIKSKSDRVIFPLQDILGLDSKHRFNKPGTISKNNWTWRFDLEKISNQVIDDLSKLTDRYNR